MNASTRFAGVSTIFGVFLVLVCGPLYVLAVSISKQDGLRDVDWFAPAPIQLSFTPDSNEALFTDLLTHILSVLVAVLANGSLAFLIGGTVLLAVGLCIFGNTYYRKVGALLFGGPKALVFWGSVGLLVLFGTSPVFRGIVLEFLRGAFAAGTVFLLSAGLVVIAEERASPLVTIALLGPSVLASVFLTVVAAMFASKSFNEYVVQLTDTLVEFVLIDVFSHVGLNEILTDLFELSGVAYLYVWLAIVVVPGWIVGVWLVTRNISIKRWLRWRI